MLQGEQMLISSLDERKRLGQYYTGEPLARVLAALGEARRAQSLLDPMAGSGDMLVAARSVGASSAELTAVEIDPAAASICNERLSSSSKKARSTVLIRDAFSPKTWVKYRKTQWDLVITNPPYVRYQRTSRRAVGRVNVPSAAGIRNGLREIVQARGTLESNEKAALGTLVDNYSGLADLAVPSWLLCASLVRVGGRLAMVVPDTWLSRDYSFPVLYLLRRFFKLEYVIEDKEAAWFEDVLVRTTLVVALRVPDRSTAFGETATAYLHASLDEKASTTNSLVGALSDSAELPELSFVEMLRGLDVEDTLNRPGLAARWVEDQSLREQLLSRKNHASWLKEIEPTKQSLVRVLEDKAEAHVPRKVREILGDASTPLCTAADLGWKIGQGLRTGANRFFYGEVLSLEGELTQLAVDQAVSNQAIMVPDELLHTAVRKQRDLVRANGHPRESSGRVIVLANYALTEDIREAQRKGVEAPFKPIPEPFAEHIRRAALVNIGSPDVPRYIPEMSAVSPNIRSIDPEHPQRSPRFWYQLPAFASRHVGALFVPRVNHLHPHTFVNCERVVIDANFSTIWNQDGNKSLPLYSLVAILHSTWTLVMMEASGTVLGGGALKLEATQLRRMPLPRITEAGTLRSLAALGRKIQFKLEIDERFRAEIDSVLWPTLGVTPRMANVFEGLRHALLAARNSG